MRAAIAGAAVLSLAGCQFSLDSAIPKEKRPVPEKLLKKMKAKGMASTAPIMLRIFKQENELEVWKKNNTGRYALLTSYEICKWSGKLGPKFKEGDRQAPEGFYSVNKHQMNPNSQYHLSFNMGFPNAYDRSHGRTGTHLMIHGACSSAGCYSMTDEKVEEIYAMARDAFSGGQKAFQIQAMPFRMTAKNMAKHRDHEHFEFWKMLKQGTDQFEITKVPPKVDVCEQRYVFNTESNAPYRSTATCPVMEMPASLATAYVKQQDKELLAFEKFAAKADKRKPVALEPVTLETVLPGVAVKQPEPPAVSEPAVASEGEAVGSIPAKPKPEGEQSLESKLTPAG
ncbi:MAG: L,D-transpeptidase family protein [Pseudomonadota bacterium]